MNLPIMRLLLPALVLLATAALARPWYLPDFETAYPDSTLPGAYSCGICHYDPKGGGERNTYGRDFEQYFDFMAVEPLDSDGDGATNGFEIATDTRPGFAGTRLAISPPGWRRILRTGVRPP